MKPVFLTCALVVGAASFWTLGSGLSAQGQSTPKPAASAAPPIATELKTAASFDSIANKKARSAALFEEAAKVITHPRCMNCHPAGDRPAQGDNRHPHMPPAMRGDGGVGVAGMQCISCHGQENYSLTGTAIRSMPGNPAWALAPIEMAWQGKTVPQICAQLKDKKRNGDRDLKAIHEHMAKDPLVGWGWSPGDGRAPAPGTQDQFGEIIQAWIDTGAECPVK